VKGRASSHASAARHRPPAASFPSPRSFVVCTRSLRASVRPSRARKSALTLCSDLVALRPFLDQAELLQALHGNPVESDLVELRPGSESKKQAALGGAKPDCRGVHRSTVPPQRRGATEPMCEPTVIGATVAVVRPESIELPAFAFEARRSIR
jgi:hypothetical protein